MFLEKYYTELLSNFNYLTIIFLEHGLFLIWNMCVVICGIGSVSLVWCLIWFSLVSNSPLEDKFISEAERSYLKNTTGNILNKNDIIPWKKIFMSKQIWAYFNEFFCAAWTGSFLIVSLPLYVKDILKSNTRDIGLISGIPLLCGFVMQLLFAYSADYLRSNKICSASTVHKVFVSGGQFFVLIFLLITSFCSNFWICVVFICLTRVAFVLAMTSYISLPLDLAGQYAAVIESISISFNGVGFLLSPLVQGYLVPNQTQAEWNHYLLFLTAIIVYGVLVFLIYGSGETQKWAVPQNLEDADCQYHQGRKLSKQTAAATS